VKHLIDAILLADLQAHLELGARGAVPSPEFAGQLLRRLNQAIRENPSAPEEKAEPPQTATDITIRTRVSVTPESPPQAKAGGT
jgi:hypothetical protein